MSLLVSFFVMVIFLFFCGCRQEQDHIDDEPPATASFNAAAFYETNTVEIIADAEYGITNTGTGLIISGYDFPIIVSNLHVAGKYGGFIRVKFPGEADFINQDTMIDKEIIEVLAYDESLDLCIFKVDYKPQNLYNNLTEEISETEVTPFMEWNEVAVGTKIISLGNAGGKGIKKLEGEIVSKERVVYTRFGYLPLIQTTLATEEGCSGGAMFDEEGRFLGITSFGGGATWGEEFSFSIPAVFVNMLYREAMENRFGKIEKIDAKLSVEGEERQPTAINIIFIDLDIKLKLINETLIVCDSDQYLGYEVIKFGETIKILDCTYILAEAMKYSLNGNSKTFKINIERLNNQETLEFTDYKLKC